MIIALIFIIIHASFMDYIGEYRKELKQLEKLTYEFTATNYLKHIHIWIYRNDSHKIIWNTSSSNLYK